MPTTIPMPPAHIIRRISVRASVDPRTVERAIRGERVQPMTLERIARAMATEGLPAPLAVDLPARKGAA